MNRTASSPDSAALPAGAEIPGLNGIRAIAVSLVFFAHSGLEHLIPGGLGVTLFFVLSGYLITTLMRREHAARGRLDLGAFYLRRLLRLMPPLLIVVAAAALLSGASLVEGHFTRRGLLSVLFYFGNYHVIASDFGGLPAGIGVVWSLAVEEHYYLLYPPLAMLLLPAARRGRFIAVLVVLCVAILAWRIGLFRAGASEAYLTMASDTRADAILIGCLLALMRNPAIDPVTPADPRREAALVLGCLLVLLATLSYRGEFFRLTLRYSLQSLAIAPLLYLAVARATQAPYRWLNGPLPVYLGTVSYTIYLSHQLILYGVQRHWPELSWAPALALTAALTLATAEAMRRWVEQPCAALRRRLHARPPRRGAAPARALAP